MDRNQINTFIALYECGSMHKAADRLFISQQAVSKSLQSLEAETGVQLFTRSSAEVTETPAGELFYREAISMREIYDALQEKLQAAAAGKRTVSLACAYGTLYQV